MPKASPEMEKIDYLISLLHVSDIDTRWRAARTLSGLGDIALSPLLSRIYDDDDNVRLLSIWALGRMGDSRAADAVSRCRYDDNHLVKMASEGAISRLSQKDRI